MRIELPEEPETQKWQSVIGLPRDAIIQKFLANDWIVDLAPRKALAVSEYWEFPFAIQFRESPHFGMDPIRFTLAFNYKDNPDQIRLADVSFAAERYKSWGKKLLTSVVHLALDLGIRKIAVRPGRDGSWYWPYRGAMLSEWPDNLSSDAIATNARNICSNRQSLAPQWKEADFVELSRVICDEDCMGLNHLLARDDLPVLRDGVSIPLRRGLVQNIMLGDCFFDFNHPWTQGRLLACNGLDVRSPLSYSSPIRPGFEESDTSRNFNHS